MTETTTAIKERAARAEWANAIHIVSTSKGGVGKSFSALCIAEYVIDSKRSPRCYDTDQANPTFFRFKGLAAERVNLLRGNTINPAGFDWMTEEILKHEGPFVVDTGSNSFHPLWDYIVSQGLFELLREAGCPIVIHAPIAPTPDLDDTLLALDAMCRHAPDASVVMWLNERDSPINFGVPRFQDLSVVKEHANKLAGSVLVANRREEFHRSVVRKMLTNHQLFREAIESEWLLNGSRLMQVRNDIFRQLAELGI